MLNHFKVQLEEKYDAIQVDYDLNSITLTIEEDIEIKIPMEMARKLSETIESIVHDGTFKEEEEKRIQAELRVSELEEELENEKYSHEDWEFV